MSHTPHELHEEFPDQVEKMHQLKETDAHFANLFDQSGEVGVGLGDVRRIGRDAIQKPGFLGLLDFFDVCRIEKEFHVSLRSGLLAFLHFPLSPDYFLTLRLYRATKEEAM